VVKVGKPAWPRCLRSVHPDFCPTSACSRRTLSAAGNSRARRAFGKCAALGVSKVHANTLTIRNLSAEDPAAISNAFAKNGWNKPKSQYETYLREQEADQRVVLVAEVSGRFAGYVTVQWNSDYAPFVTQHIPEIRDFNVLPMYRRKGIGTRLMDEAEAIACERSTQVGIGVGMYPDYGNAQRLYLLRAYVPDGRGLCYKNEALEPMAIAMNDDDLVLFSTKKLR
jgi:GNAT superfamily N-acetyltransferase